MKECEVCHEVTLEDMTTCPNCGHQYGENISYNILEAPPEINFKGIVSEEEKSHSSLSSQEEHHLSKTSFEDQPIQKNWNNIKKSKPSAIINKILTPNVKWIINTLIALGILLTARQCF